jgi:hypothetical protein
MIILCCIMIFRFLQRLCTGSAARADHAAGGFVDVMILVFTYVNIRFFWLPIVSAPSLTRD